LTIAEDAGIKNENRHFTPIIQEVFYENKTDQAILFSDMCSFLLLRQ
jgi:hypothetical protein